MEDYLLSNKYYFTDKKRILPLIRLVRGERFASALKAYLEVQPAYLSAAFHAIEQEHGSFENYVRYGLDLSEVEIAHLRAVYLE